MVDHARLARLLARIDDRLVALRALATDGATRVRADPHRLGHAKYLFVTGIEGIIDVSHHVVSSEGWGVPDTNAGALRLLAGRGVIEPEAADRLVAAVGFRNVLVHGYAEVDDDRVVAYLDHLGELAGFVTAVTGWAAGQPG